MSSQNGSDDQASIAQAVAALLHGEAVRVRFADQAERRRLGRTFRRYASRLGFEAQTRTEGRFLIVRWIKPERSRGP